MILSKARSLSPVFVAVLLAGFVAPALAQTPTSLPAHRSEAEINQSLRELSVRVNQLIGDDAVLADATKRPAVAAAAVPLLKQFRAEFDELVAVQPAMGRRAPGLHLQVDQTLAILGDGEGAERLNAMVTSKTPAESLAGQGAWLMVKWVLAGKDEAAQTKIVDAIETLGQAHTESTTLTLTTAGMAKSAATPDLADRLYKVATEVMKNPAVAQVKMQREQVAAAEKLKQLVGKPFVLAATTVDGKGFTTADWAGKVVLVDFWATWCAPCKAELPNVQKLYSEQHERGLEIVGVSNDFSADALRSFVANAGMPWPQLLNAEAASQQEWNPTTLGYGIDGIPHMFVIDKKGILRSADARNDYATLIPKLLAE